MSASPVRELAFRRENLMRISPLLLAKCESSDYDDKHPDYQNDKRIYMLLCENAGLPHEFELSEQERDYYGCIEFDNAWMFRKAIQITLTIEAPNTAPYKEFHRIMKVLCDRNYYEALAFMMEAYRGQQIAVIAYRNDHEAFRCAKRAAEIEKLPFTKCRQTLASFYIHCASRSFPKEAYFDGERRIDISEFPKKGLEILLSLPQDDCAVQGEIAGYYVMRGDFEKALEYIENAEESNYYYSAYLKAFIYQRKGGIENLKRALELFEGFIGTTDYSINPNIYREYETLKTTIREEEESESEEDESEDESEEEESDDDESEYEDDESEYESEIEDDEEACLNEIEDAADDIENIVVNSSQ